LRAILDEVEEAKVTIGVNVINMIKSIIRILSSQLCKNTPFNKGGRGDFMISLKIFTGTQEVNEMNRRIRLNGCIQIYLDLPKFAEFLFICLNEAVFRQLPMGFGSGNKLDFSYYFEKNCKKHGVFVSIFVKSTAREKP
jgi:hypothetical protein